MHMLNLPIDERRNINMWFEPGFGLLTALLFDSIEFLGEKTRGGTIDDYDRERIDSLNRMLNNDIRRTKEKYGLKLAEHALDNIESHIRVTNKNFTFQYAKGKIILDLDNFDYIIALLEKCANDYSDRAEKAFSEKYIKVSEEYREKAESYQKLVDTVRAKREEKLRTDKEEKERKEEAEKTAETASLGCLVVLIVAVILLGAIIFR